MQAMCSSGSRGEASARTTGPQPAHSEIASHTAAIRVRSRLRTSGLRHRDRSRDSEKYAVKNLLIQRFISTFQRLSSTFGGESGRPYVSLPCPANQAFSVATARNKVPRGSVQGERSIPYRKLQRAGHLVREIHNLLGRVRPCYAAANVGHRVLDTHLRTLHEHIVQMTGSALGDFQHRHKLAEVKHVKETLALYPRIA